MANEQPGDGFYARDTVYLVDEAQANITDHLGNLLIIALEADGTIQGSSTITAVQGQSAVITSVSQNASITSQSSNNQSAIINK